MPIAFIVLLVIAAAFMWLTGTALPPLVASHFAAGGFANGFMPRSAYLALMLGITVAVPLLIVLSARLVGILPVQMINLPNRDSWLAPERRAASIASLSKLSTCFASALVIFLCFTHWLVVRANELQPPHLEQTPFMVGLVLFMAVTALWVIVMLMRFMRLP